MEEGGTLTRTLTRFEVRSKAAAHTVGFARENETKMVIANSELKKRVLHVGKRKVIKRRRV